MSLRLPRSRRRAWRWFSPCFRQTPPGVQHGDSGSLTAVSWHHHATIYKMRGQMGLPKGRFGCHTIYTRPEARNYRPREMSKTRLPHPRIVCDNEHRGARRSIISTSARRPKITSPRPRLVCHTVHTGPEDRNYRPRETAKMASHTPG